MQKTYDICIIGGGIVGLATAYKLRLQKPDLKILVLEKEAELAAHQTGHNSGVIHSGIYYKPGSYKAIKCVEGRRELVAFAKAHHIAHDICGKIIVATDASELNHLNKVFQHGQQNGVEDIELISADVISEIEPHCKGISGIRVGCTGIIDYPAVTKTLARLVESQIHNKILTNTKVLNLKFESETYTITTPSELFYARFIINTSGLQADRTTKKTGQTSRAKIVGFRGDYYDLTPEAQHKVKHLIYPVPNPKFPFLGVHFTRMVHGGIECGPNAVFVFDREGYSKTAFRLKDTFDALAFKGTWKFFAKHWKFGLDEYRGAFSKAYFLKRLQKLLPDLKAEDIVSSRCGIRAMALGPEGDMLDDFHIEWGPHAMHVINSPSPAATACLAYGEEIAQQAITRFNIL